MKILDKIFKSKVYIANKYLYVQNRASEYYIRIYLGDKLLIIEFNKLHIINIMLKHGIVSTAFFISDEHLLNYSIQDKAVCLSSVGYETGGKEKGLVLFRRNNPIKTQMIYTILKQV